MDTLSSSQNEQQPPEVVERPPGQLHHLPLEFRWEATRRHPYYVVFWENAEHYRQGRLGECVLEKKLRFAAFLMLGAIGVTGQPISPATEFEDLGAGIVDPAFLSGAIQPQTFRAIAVLLLCNLPPAELAVLGSIFQIAGNAEYSVPKDDVAKSAQRTKALGKIARMPSSVLDSIPDSPLFFIHMEASQRTIQSSVEQLVRNWKQRLGIGERRLHVKKISKCLEVWDLREGWKDGSYQRCEEHTLRDIASRLKVSISTVASRYRDAFRWITGHEFSPELWGRLLAPLKFSEVFQTREAILSAPMRRRLSSPVRRPVPESVVSPPPTGDSASSVVTPGNTISDDMDFVEFMLDLEELIAKNWENEEIATRLEYPIDLVEYYRGHLEEQKQI